MSRCSSALLFVFLAVSFSFFSSQVSCIALCFVYLLTKFIFFFSRFFFCVRPRSHHARAGTLHIIYIGGTGADIEICRAGDEALWGGGIPVVAKVVYK